MYAAYRGAVGGLPADATVAAPLNDGAEAAIPVYAGRLIATHRPLAFIDQTQRQQAVYEFFSGQATDGFRRALIDRYRVRYIVVPAADAQLLAAITPFGSVIRRGPTFDTIAVRR